MPVAVNVDTRESAVKSMSSEDVFQSLKGTGVKIVRSKEGLLTVAEETRTSRSLWRIFMMAGLAFFVLEGLFAEWLFGRAAGGRTTNGHE